MKCKELHQVLDRLYQCTQGDDGLHYVTQCLYPSFTPVEVVIHPRADGYRVHDNAGAARSTWDHSRDDRLAKRMISRHAEKYKISVMDDETTLYADAPNVDWLFGAIMAVANASAGAAHAAFDRIAAANESDLKIRIHSLLSRIIPEPSVKFDFVQVGQSGKEHHFDFAINKSEDQMILIDAVAPHPISISSKYVAFADTPHTAQKFAVHDKPLLATDAQLLLQVSQLVPFKSLKPGIQRELAVK